MQSAHVHPSLRVNVRCVTPPRDDDARDQHQQQDHVENEIRMCLRSDTDRDREGSDQRAEKRESLHGQGENRRRCGPHQGGDETERQHRSNHALGGRSAAMFIASNEDIRMNQ